MSIHPITAVEPPVGKPMLDIFGHGVSVVISGEQTAGAFTVLDGEADPTIGPPLHRHHGDHEVFHILEGTVLFELDGERHVVQAGEVIHVQPGVVHRYQIIGDARAKMVLWVQPAGIDQFFVELDAELKQDGPPNMGNIAALHARYGMDLLGPPLSAEQQA